MISAQYLKLLHHYKLLTKNTSSAVLTRGLVNSTDNKQNDTTHFGFQTVKKEQKQQKGF